MLDFLRRKDRRKQPSHENVGALGGLSGTSQTSKVYIPAVGGQPLRDRNPAPVQRTSSPSKGPLNSSLSNPNLSGSIQRTNAIVTSPVSGVSATGSGHPASHSQNLHRLNTQHHQATAQRRPKPVADKENSALRHLPSDSKPSDRTDASNEQSRARWGKRQQHAAVVAAATSGVLPSAQDGKKKRNRRFKNKHEPVVVAKSVTTDRRRSIKVPSHQVQQQQALGKTDTIPVPKRPAAAKTQMQSPPQRTNTGYKTQQQFITSPAAVPPQDPPSLTWPHIDLDNMLRQGNIAHADVPVRRIAMAATRDNPTRVKMVTEGVAVSLITLLRHASCTLEMRRDATHAIAELAVHDACEDALVAANTVPVLVWLINPNNNQDPPTVSNACRGLRNLLGGKEATAILAAKYGCVEPLLSLVSGRTSPRMDSSDVIVESVAAVSNLLHHGSRFQGYVIKHGGLNALSALGTTTDDDEAMYHVVNVLAECAKETRWHKLIVSHDGILIAFRALRNARDPDVLSEASRLVANVAVTHKARLAVREAGILTVLLDRLSRCKSFEKSVPAFDIVNALANICVDSRSATEALCQKDAAGLLLNVYTASKAQDELVKTAFNALQVLAHGSATRRAKVLYSVGIHVKQAGMAGLPVKRLYDLRQAILEDVENGEKDPSAAMPESLERLSRASVRMINSGVVNHARGQLQLIQRGQSPNLVTSPTRVGSPAQASRLSGKNTGYRDMVPTGTNLQSENAGPLNIDSVENRDSLSKKAIGYERNKFKSTGRVVSVTYKHRRGLEGPGIRQLAGGRLALAADPEDVNDLPRGNEEEMKTSDADIRARMLRREADGNMTQEFFELGQVLGKGGYGSVFMAKDLRTGDLVAIKRFHNSGSLVDKKAIKEQKIWKGLHHPNVVEFKGSFVGDNGSLNLVVEYVDGLSLAEHLSQYTAFPETLVAEIARQVLCGLQYLHDNGVTHRDLKPANILVDNSAAVKICDFGVSRSENVQTINPGQQHMVGTPWYIAPEMVEYRPYTTGVDIWSLGCTVLELATGRRPYHELSAMQVLFRMVEDRCPPIPGHLSPEAKDFLKSCWVWDPQERPSAKDLLRHPFILKARKFSDSSKQSSTGNSSGIEEIPSS